MFFPLILWMMLIMLMLGSLPFVELSSVRKYAICSSMTGPLIFMGTMPLCCSGILSDDLNVPIVAFCSQFLVYVRNFPSFVYNNSFLCPKQFHLLGKGFVRHVVLHP